VAANADQSGVTIRWEGIKYSRSAHLELIWEIPAKDELNKIENKGSTSTLYLSTCKHDGRCLSGFR